MSDPSEAKRGQCHPAGTQQPSGVMASRHGGHRGRRPDHDDIGIARELVRASSASCLYRRGSKRGNPWESPALSKLPVERPVAPPGRSWLLNAETAGTRGRARVAKEPRKGVRQSHRPIVAKARSHPTLRSDESAAGLSQPGGASARGAAVPGSQGTNSIRGTWSSEGAAGCHLRTVVEAAGTPSPSPRSRLRAASPQSDFVLSAGGEV
jgi:hypothetical protein